MAAPHHHHTGATARRGNPTDIVAIGYNMNVTRVDIDRLRNRELLNDVVINFYFQLIAARSEIDDSEDEPTLPRTYSFLSFFYTRLSHEGHKGVKRWTRDVDIFSYEILLVPVHIGEHWSLAVIDFRNKSVNYYDSNGGTNDRCAFQLLQYMREEMQHKKKVDLDAMQWSHTNVSGVPQQDNALDCGVFVCKFGECLARDAPLNFTSAQIPALRMKMANEIVMRRLSRPDS